MAFKDDLLPGEHGHVLPVVVQANSLLVIYGGYS
jgi:hypothetical protein